MSYLLASLLLLAAGFISVLAYFDLPPRLALIKMFRRGRRSWKGLTGIKPTLADFPYSRNDFPYRRIKHMSGPLHRPVILNLETSEGTGQACHPDVAYIADGFGREKWRYWMACTPYPYTNYMVENPEIFASHDGIDWIIPEGLRNPIIPPPRNAFDHHSDTDILFYRGELWLFYRETKRTGPRPEFRIFHTRSSSGTTWSKPLEVFCETSGTEPMSPALIHDGNSFLMWTVEFSNDSYRIVRRISADGIRWGGARTCSIEGLSAERHAWHIDVIKEPDRLSALLVTGVGSPSSGQRIHYAYSLDNGETWKVGPFLFEQAYEFEERSQYRGTFRRCEDKPESYEIWYSAFNQTWVSSIAYLRAVREGNTLLPDASRRTAAEIRELVPR